MAERSFVEEVKKLRLGDGDVFSGEGILAVTKALLESGVSYVAGYQGAPISHLMDVLADAQDLVAQHPGAGIGLGHPPRLRVNGQMVSIDDLSPLKKTEKHDFDVVVDRLRIKPESQQRLAESFETALNLAEGRVIALNMDTDEEHAFSSRYACPVCHHSLTELEPRLFSFNNPVGACPACDGLGCVDVFDPKRVVAFPELSLASGAIKGWDRRNQFYFQMLQCLATHYGFDLELRFWIADPSNGLTNVRGQVLLGLWDAFKAAGQDVDEASVIRDLRAYTGNRPPRGPRRTAHALQPVASGRHWRSGSRPLSPCPRRWDGSC